MLKKLFANSAIYGIAPQIPRIVSLFIMPIITAHLTSVDYGIYGTLNAYTMAISAFSTLGFSAVVQILFFKSKQDYKELWSHIYGFLQYWMIVFAIIQAVLLYCIMPNEAYENRWLIIILSNFNTVFFGPSALFGSLYYQLSQKPLPVAIRSLFSGLITLLANYLFIAVWEYGYLGWYISNFIGTFFVNITYWYDLNIKLGIRPNHRFKWDFIKEKLNVAIPTIPHYYSYFLITSSNRMVMDNCNISMAKIGEFNLAYQFSTYVETLIGAIERAIYPMCLDEISRKNAIQEKKLNLLFILLSFTGTFFIALWMKEIFYILVKNDELVLAYPYAAILVMALNYRPIYVSSTNIYFYKEKTKYLLLITFTAGIIAFIANVIFIPVWGLWAAVVITYIAFLYQGYSGFFFRPYKEHSAIRMPVLKILTIQILLTVIVYFLLDLTMVNKLIVSIIILLLFVISLFQIMKININDLKKIFIKR